MHKNNHALSTGREWMCGREKKCLIVRWKTKIDTEHTSWRPAAADERPLPLTDL